MTSGSPNYQRLHDIGKLPENMRDKIPGLKDLDEANKKIKELEGGTIEVKCSFEGCNYVAKGTEGQVKNRMKLHAKSHEIK